MPVSVESGASTLPAFVYLFNGGVEALGDAWSYEAWRESHLESFVQSCVEWSAAEAGWAGLGPESERHISGLWLGEAAPHASLPDVPTNPIKWSLSLVRPEAGLAVTAFGGGVFEDAADIPGNPVILFVLSGTWEPGDAAGSSAAASDNGAVRLTKQYVSAGVPASLTVRYDGRLSKEDGAWVLKGQWANASEGSFGSFACRRE